MTQQPSQHKPLMSRTRINPLVTVVCGLTVLLAMTGCSSNAGEPNTTTNTGQEACTKFWSLVASSNGPMHASQTLAEQIYKASISGPQTISSSASKLATSMSSFKVMNDQTSADELAAAWNAMLTTCQEAGFNDPNNMTTTN